MPPQNFNPYDVLGVDRNADDVAVKGAYRQAAKNAHPDHGGSREAWADVSRAYALLTDQRRRKHYDRTGHADEGFADDLSAAAAGCLETTFMKVVNDCLVHGRDVEQTDAMPIIKQALAKEIAFEIKARDEADGTLKIVEKMRKRLRFKGRGPNLLDHVLGNRAHLLGAFIANSQRAQAIRERAIELLKAYEYAFDKAPAGNPWPSAWQTALGQIRTGPQFGV